LNNKSTLKGSFIRLSLVTGSLFLTYFLVEPVRLHTYLTCARIVYLLDFVPISRAHVLFRFTNIVCKGLVTKKAPPIRAGL